MRLPRLTTKTLGGVGAALILVGAYLVLSSRAAPDESLLRIKRAGVLVVGLDPSYPPFEVVNGQGQLAGYDVELAAELARRLGVPARFVSIDFGSMFEALDVGKFDLILGGVSPDPDFATTLGFTSPYYDDGLVTVTNRDATGTTIGVESGSDSDLQLDQLRSKLVGYEFQHFDDQDQIRALVESGSLRGAIVDLVTARAWAGEAPSLSIGSTLLSSSPYVIAARRADGALLREVDRVLRSMMADGFTAGLERRWLK